MLSTFYYFDMGSSIETSGREEGEIQNNQPTFEPTATGFTENGFCKITISTSRNIKMIVLRPSPEKDFVVKDETFSVPFPSDSKRVVAIEGIPYDRRAVELHDSLGELMVDHDINAIIEAAKVYVSQMFDKAQLEETVN